MTEPTGDAAARVAALLTLPTPGFVAPIASTNPGFVADGGHCAATKPADRWAHLPGGGVGPWRPPASSRIRTRIVGMVKPVVMLGFVAVSLYLAVHMFGGVVGGVGSGLKGGVSPSPTPTQSAPAAAHPHPTKPVRK